MNERLKLIRKNANMTQKEFATSVCATRDAIASYETGRSVPPPPLQSLICQTFNVNPVWLETGEGKPYKEGLMPELVRALRNMPDVQALLEELLPRMSIEDWQAINDLVRRFKRNLDQHREE